MEDKSKIVKDGWGNMLTGYGTKANKADNLAYLSNCNNRLSDEELSTIWNGDGFSRRVITCVAEDMVNKGFHIAGDPGNIILDELDSLNWTGNFFNALCQSRLYGGSAILMGLMDGQRLDKEVKLNSIKGCNFLRVIPKGKMRFDESDIDTDPQSSTYGEPLKFIISDNIQQNEYKVHRSRLLLFPWIETSPIQMANGKQLRDRMWGDSVLNYTSKQIANLSVFHDSLSNLVQEAVIGKYKIANLSQMLANGEENSLMTRLDIMNVAKGVINGVVLDADNDEDYTRDSISFAGMNGVADTMMVLLSCVSEIPVTRLFGRSPSGLDASGESDLKIYYDMVTSYQKSMMTLPMKKLVFYVNKYKDAIRIESDQSLTQSTVNGKVTGNVMIGRPTTIGEVSLSWNPLYQMTEKENADVYKSNADADLAYLEAGILSAEEIRVNRFVGGYNQHISVQSSDLPSSESTEVEESEEKEAPEEENEEEKNI